MKIIDGHNVECYVEDTGNGQLLIRITRKDDSSCIPRIIVVGMPLDADAPAAVTYSGARKAALDLLARLSHVNAY